MPEEASALRYVNYRHNKTFTEVQISGPAVLSRVMDFLTPTGSPVGPAGQVVAMSS